MNRDPSDIHRYKSGNIVVHCHLFSPITITTNYRLFEKVVRGSPTALNVERCTSDVERFPSPWVPQPSTLNPQPIRQVPDAPPDGSKTQFCSIKSRCLARPRCILCSSVDDF